MTVSLPATAVLRISRGSFDPGRFAEVDAASRRVADYLVPAIKQLPGLISYYAGTSADGSTVHASIWDSDEHAAQMEARLRLGACTTARQRGSRRLWKHSACPPADHRGHGALVTGSGRPAEVPVYPGGIAPGRGTSAGGPTGAAGLWPLTPGHSVEASFRNPSLARLPMPLRLLAGDLARGTRARAVLVTFQPPRLAVMSGTTAMAMSCVRADVAAAHRDAASAALAAGMLSMNPAMSRASAAGCCGGIRWLQPGRVWVRTWGSIAASRCTVSAVSGVSRALSAPSTTSAGWVIRAAWPGPNTHS